MDAPASARANPTLWAFWPNFAVCFVVIMYAAFVGLLLFWPAAIVRVLQTEDGPWMGGLTVGVMLGLMTLGITVVAGLLNLQRR